MRPHKDKQPMKLLERIEYAPTYCITPRTRPTLSLYFFQGFTDYGLASSTSGRIIKGHGDYGESNHQLHGSQP